MKKVIVIVLLIMVLSALLIGSGVCLADDDSQTNYYYVDKGYELYVYSNANRESIVMQIPATYAFEYVGAQDDFIKIKYNSYEGFITESEFNSYCKPVTSKWGDNPYFYTISLKSSDIATERVTLYQLDRTPYDDTSAKTSVTINNVYGYYHNETGYYFLVDTTTMVYGNPITATGYIKASDTTNYSSFTKDTITTSAGYTEETKVVEQAPPSGDADSTIKDSDDNGNTSLPATNNFERYLLIAVIAVLCVVIIILIFAPNKSRRKQ